jgi:transcriptional regulator with XRE-family HTH domain
MPARSSTPYCAEQPTEALAKRIGAAIRSLRKERKLSQRRLAEAMGTARSYISKLERGLLVPSLQTLERATSALGIDIADLFLRLRRRSSHLGGDGNQIKKEEARLDSDT